MNHPPLPPHPTYSFWVPVAANGMLATQPLQGEICTVTVTVVTCIQTLWKILQYTRTKSGSLPSAAFSALYRKGYSEVLLRNY